MRFSSVRRAIATRLSSILAIAMLAITSGCVASGPPVGPLASAAGMSSATLAFESIDGPPPAVFTRLVAALNDAAEARRVPVVSRNGPATYRVRAYVSAVVEGSTTSFAWVWDVYDTDRRRALRLTGQEPVPATGRPRDAWSAADDEVLRRIARNGMERVAAFLRAPGASAVAFAPEAVGPVAALAPRP